MLQAPSRPAKLLDYDPSEVSIPSSLDKPKIIPSGWRFGPSFSVKEGYEPLSCSKCGALALREAVMTVTKDGQQNRFLPVRCTHMRCRHIELRDVADY